MRRPPKQPIKPLAPGSDVEEGVTPEHERLVGQVIIAWGKLEAALDNIIWSIFKLKIEYGRIITNRLDVTGKCQMLRSLAPLALSDPDAADLIEVITDIESWKDARNMIAHGMWGTAVPSGHPVVLSLRPKHAPTSVVGETFPAEKMAHIAFAIDSLKDDLRRFYRPQTQPQEQP